MPGDAQAQIVALQDATRVLAAAGIPHALIGGIAVNVRASHPRATGDVDLAADSTAARDPVVVALAGAGFVLRGSYEFSENFRHPNGEPVQVTFDELLDGAIRRAGRLDIGEVSVPVATVDDLIALKERAAADPGRRRSKALQDLADVARLRGDVEAEDEGWGAPR